MTAPAIGPCPQEWTASVAPVRPHGRDSVVEAHEAGRPARAGAVQRRSESRLHAGNASLDLEAGGGERVAEVARALVLLVPELGMVVDEPAHRPR